MFNVGDIITSKEGNPGQYGFTVPGVMLKVVALENHATIMVEVLSVVPGTRYEDSLNRHIGDETPVCARYFELVDNYGSNERLRKLDAEMRRLVI